MSDSQRWAIALELHSRFYHDIGLEVAPRSWEIATPYCAHGPRVLGSLLTELPPRGSRPWVDYVQSCFETLNVSSWLQTRHLGCFHRRSRACYDLVMSIAAVLVETDPRLTVQLVHNAEIGGAGRLDGPPAKPPRVLQIHCGDRTVAALRSDGLALTHRGTTDVRDLWRRGHSARSLASYLASENLGEGNHGT